MGLNIEGKIALITGANRGIGRAIVTSFIEHGAQKVYLGVRELSSAESLTADYGDKVQAIHTDLANAESIYTAAKIAQDAEVVVNNVGILNLAGPLDGHTETAFLEEMETNVLGLLRMAKAFAPVVFAHQGAFVQINSVASLVSGTQFSTYSASKAAAYSFTQAIRLELAEKNVHVLSVHPGPIFSDMSGKTGMNDIAEPPSVVAEGIVKALAEGKSHLFPDAMAREFESVYQPFMAHFFNN